MGERSDLDLLQLMLVVSAAVTFALIVLRENAAGFHTKVGQGQVQLAFSFAIAMFLKVRWIWRGSVALLTLKSFQTFCGTSFRNN